ncbi:MAG: hypothetical protein WCE30_24055 [Mycobacterium sp.]
MGRVVAHAPRELRCGGVCGEGQPLAAVGSVAPPVAVRAFAASERFDGV